MGEGRGGGRGAPPWALVATLAGGTALALLAVAAAGSGSSPFGGGASGRMRPPDVLLSLVLTLLLVVLVAGVVLLVLAIVWRERVELPPRRRWNVWGYLLLAALVVIVVWQRPRLAPRQATVAPTPAPPTSVPEAGGSATGPGAGWVPLLVLVAALIVVAAVALAAERRRRLRLDDRPAAERLAELVEAALADLAGETDPRRAVIAAYAVMERGLAAAGMPRRIGETPLEHTTRVLLDAHVPAQPVRRLAALFERARFSTHPIDAAQRDQALDALGEVRAALRERSAALAGGAPTDRGPA